MSFFEEVDEIGRTGIVSLVLFAVLEITGCGGAQVGPFPPPGPPIYCDGSPLSCPSHTHCGYAGAAKRLECLEGEGEDVTDPWAARKRDAGAP